MTKNLPASFSLTSPSRYALIGSGRLAFHLKHWFATFGASLALWSRNGDANFNTGNLQEVLEGVEVVCLAISDRALGEWVERPELHGKIVVHFSGSQRFSSAWGFHPLMTFGPKLYSFATYGSIPFVADQGFRSSQVFPFLRNSVYELEPDKKALYHGLCHMIANFPALLWVEVFRSFERDLKLPCEILKPMVEQVVSNTFTSREKALAGPVQRRDFATLARHEEALQNNSSLVEIYGAWTRWALAQPLPETHS